MLAGAGGSAGEMIAPTRRLSLAVTSLRAGGGGIARVARLMARVLAGEAADDRLQLRTIGLYDETAISDLGVELVAARGSRLHFTAAVHWAALRSSHCLSDSLAMARAHNHLPLLRRPLLAWIHGIEVWEGTRADRVATAQRADVLVANSAYTRERAERAHGGFAAAQVCWLGTESDEPPDAQRLAGPPLVLVLGRLEPGRDKGHQALIDAWPTVVGAVPDARLLIVGTGPDLARIRGLATQSPAAARIEVGGFVPDSEMTDVWARTTVFAMPSRGEGFGLVYVEAMRQGIPVIASVHDAAPEINLDGETGYNIDLQRRGDLADRLVLLLRDRDLAARLGVAGQRRWAQHFRYSSFRTRFLSILHDFVRLQ
jgi:phosphatidylinositol alpha-1,6-mannosyltransferase